MLCKICVVQIQPRKRALDHAGYTAATRQHGLGHTDHTDQESICPEISRYVSRIRWSVDDLSEVCQYCDVRSRATRARNSVLVVIICAAARSSLYNPLGGLH